eukprot:scaffold23109_cov79-Isochrysis_galbana.AAC.1
MSATRDRGHRASERRLAHSQWAKATASCRHGSCPAFAARCLDAVAREKLVHDRKAAAWRVAGRRRVPAHSAEGGGPRPPAPVVVRRRPQEAAARRLQTRVAKCARHRGRRRVLSRSRHDGDAGHPPRHLHPPGVERRSRGRGPADQPGRPQAAQLRQCSMDRPRRRSRLDRRLHAPGRCRTHGMLPPHAQRADGAGGAIVGGGACGERACRRATRGGDEMAEGAAQCAHPPLACDCRRRPRQRRPRALHPAQQAHASEARSRQRNSSGRCLRHGRRCQPPHPPQPLAPQHVETSAAAVAQPARPRPRVLPPPALRIPPVNRP